MSYDDNIAIRISNLSKCYHIYDQPRDRLKQSLYSYLRRLVGKQPKHYFREFWAQRNVSFEIKKGETVGIIGRNGSGKSTLLQIICGTLAPSSGNVEVNGHVAALLELGAGFNPQFTGIENIFLYGQLLGLSREKIKESLDDIVAFAGIGDFVYQPVKTYSSGMYVRLAFAVSIARVPDVLIVDEALSVGDESFQRKCFARINELKERGTTILFVSHAASLIVELCDRAILLDSGQKIFEGGPKQTIDNYHKLLNASQQKRDAILAEMKSSDDGNKDEAVAADGGAGIDATVSKALFSRELVSQSRLEYESRGAQIRASRLETPAGEEVNLLVGGEEYVCRYTATFDRDVCQVQFGMLIKTTTGLELGGAAYPSVFEMIPEVKAGQVFEVAFRFTCLLNPGAYFINNGIRGSVGGETVYLHRIIDALMFKVQPIKGRTGTGKVDFKVGTMIHEVGN